LLFERCGCEGKECFYTPRWITEIVAVSDVTQLFSRIFCCISTVAPLDGKSTMCNNPSDDEPEEDSTESFGEPPSGP